MSLTQLLHLLYLGGKIRSWRLCSFPRGRNLSFDAFFLGKKGALGEKNGDDKLCCRLSDKQTFDEITASIKDAKQKAKDI